MTTLRKYMIIGTAVLTIGVTSLTTFAASIYATPAEAVAGLTGKSVEDVITEKADNGKTYGTIASENGKSEEFKDEMLQIKKDILSKRVTEGKITQVEADQIIEAIENNQANCDGTGNAGIGESMGAGFGSMMGNGQERGLGSGQNCIGLGNGSGLRNESCLTN